MEVQLAKKRFSPLIPQCNVGTPFASNGPRAQVCLLLPFLCFKIFSTLNVKTFGCICASNWLDWTGLEMPTVDFSVHCFKIVTIPVLLCFAVKTIWRKTFTFRQHFLNWWFFLRSETEFRRMFFCSVGSCRQLVSCYLLLLLLLVFCFG